MRQRKSIRKPGYDYRSPGYYFLTIVTQDRLNLFGEIIGGIMYLNDAGLMIDIWYQKLFDKFPNIKSHCHVIMPNHFHCIIQILNPVGMAPCGQPKCCGQPKINGQFPNENSGIFQIMDWFKTMTTNAYIRGVKEKDWSRFNKRLWQLRYWDHIIRDEIAFNRISEYIKENPKLWEKDILKDQSNEISEENASYGCFGFESVF